MACGANIDGSISFDTDELTISGIPASRRPADDSARRQAAGGRRHSISARQTTHRTYASLRSLLLDSYVPSWQQSGEETSDTTDMNISGRSDNLNTVRPSVAAGRVRSEFDWDFTSSQSRRHHTTLSTIDGKGFQHSALEKEYKSLKQRLQQADKKSTRTKDRLKVNEDKKQRKPPDDDETKIKDFLQSDGIGIDHFQKHINNVKSNSRKYKRSSRLQQSKGRAVKFKPVFENVVARDDMPRVPRPITPALASDISTTPPGI